MNRLDMNCTSQVVESIVLPIVPLPFSFSTQPSIFSDANAHSGSNLNKIEVSLEFKWIHFRWRNGLGRASSSCSSRGSAPRWPSSTKSKSDWIRFTASTLLFNLLPPNYSFSLISSFAFSLTQILFLCHYLFFLTRPNSCATFRSCQCRMTPSCWRTSNIWTSISLSDLRSTSWSTTPSLCVEEISATTSLTTCCRTGSAAPPVAIRTRCRLK